LIGIISIFVLSPTLLTNNKILAEQKLFENSYVNRLLENKIDYITDTSSIKYLLSHINCTHAQENYDVICTGDLYPVSSVDFIDEENYRNLCVTYEMCYADLSDIENDLYKNSGIIFSLVKNLDEIDYTVKIKNHDNQKSDAVEQYNFKREDIESKLGMKLNDIERDKYYDFLVDLSCSVDGEPSLEDAIKKYFYNRSLASSEAVYYDSFELEEDDVLELEEFETTSYTIVGKDETDKRVAVYLLYVDGKFSFIGNTFALDEMCEVVPLRLSFSKNEKGQYSLIEEAYIEDYGSYLLSRPKAYVFEKDSINKNIKDYIGQVFPEEEAYKAIHGDYENKLGMELEKTQENI
ncbi:MAG: hypothetical protein ACI4PU_05710, partial [Intestinibacter sp.]